MRRIVVCLLFVVVVGAACSGDETSTTPTTTAEATSTTTTLISATTTTTTSTTSTIPSPTGRVYKEELEILDHGADERILLQYASNGFATPLHIEITSTYNDSYWAPGGRTSEIVLIGQSVPTSDGIRLEITDGGSLDAGGLRFNESERDFSEAGLLFELVSDGSRVIQRRPGIEGATDDLLLGQPLRGFLIPLPDEPVGIGARWTYGETAFQSSGLPTDLELIAVNGPLITLQVGGSSGGYDGDRYQGNWLEVDHSGVFTLDLSSGRFAGDVWDTGNVQQSTNGIREGEAQFFERHTVVDIPAQFAPVAIETRTIDVEYEIATDGVDDGVDVQWIGSVAALVDGSARYTGTGRVVPDSGEDPVEFDVRVLPEGGTAFDSTGGLPSPTAVLDTLPIFLEEAMLHDDEVVHPFGDMWMSISLGGFRAPVLWAVESIEGSRITVVGNSDINEEFITRGAYNLIVGKVTGRFVIDFFDPFATTGSIAFDGTYDFSEFDQIDYREGWTISTSTQPTE